MIYFRQYTVRIFQGNLNLSSHQRHFSRGKNKNNTDQLQEIRLLQTEIHVLEEEDIHMIKSRKRICIKMEFIIQLLMIRKINIHKLINLFMHILECLVKLNHKFNIELLTY